MNIWAVAVAQLADQLPLTSDDHSSNLASRNVKKSFYLFFPDFLNIGKGKTDDH